MESRFSNDLSSLLLPQKQTLRIGAGSITSPFLPEKVFPILHREYPDVELSLTADIHVHLLSRMEKGELDLSVLVASGADTLSNRFVKVLARAPDVYKRQAPAFAIASLNAMDPAMWNAISEESTSW